MDRRDKIVGIIERISKKPVTLGQDDSLFDSGVLDSFALPEVVEAIEAEFGFTVPDSDLHPRKFETLSKIEAYLEGRS